MPTLDWIGKKAVVNHHREVPYDLVKCDNLIGRAMFVSIAYPARMSPA